MQIKDTRALLVVLAVAVAAVAVVRREESQVRGLRAKATLAERVMEGGRITPVAVAVVLT
jgi:hypothetical protein